MGTAINAAPGLPNRLWQVRKQRGFGQKQIARLLHHRQHEQLSRFEQGQRLPNLTQALTLEIIYGVPVRALFPGLYDHLQADLRATAQRAWRPAVQELLQRADADPGLDWCPWEELLRSPWLTPLARGQVRDHVTRLAQQIAAL